MSIWDLFSADTGTQAAAASKQAANKAARQGYNAQADALKQYTQQATGYEKQALPQWQTIFGQGTAMSPTYMGALGIGSPGQIQGAQDAFMSSIPGQMYQNQQPDIWEAALRRGGLTGRTGQIPIDLTNETMKSLNQFYPGWQNSLNPLPYETAGATGISNTFGNLAGISSALGNNLSNITGKKFDTMGAANMAYPQNVAAAQYGADANQLSALFAGLGLAGNIFGGGSGGFGSLSKLFGPSENTANMTGMYQSSPGVWADAFSNPAAGAFL